jgi:glycosyltransferase involved in cell wall biosynthesis
MVSRRFHSGRRVAAVVPARNEELLLPGCLAALHEAAERLSAVEVAVFVVADACTDGTVAVAAADTVAVIEVGGRSVGAARAAGARAALSWGAGWIGTTDADSRVPPDWLTRLDALFAAGADVVAGRVVVNDWSAWPIELPPTYDRLYAASEGHVHGANLAFTAAAYGRCGGFSALAVGEDLALVRAARRVGLRVASPADLSVLTSARRRSRLEGGFATHLRRLQAELPTGRV